MNWRLIPAILFAPLPAALLFVLYLSVRGTWLTTALSFTTGFVLFFSYLALILIGLPLHFALRWLGIRGPIAYAVWGVILSEAVQVFTLTASYVPLLRSLLPDAQYVFFGLSGGFCFWLIARPDR